MTYVHSARIITSLFALLTLIPCLGQSFPAQTKQAVKARIRPVTQARLTPRQQRYLIRYNEAGAIRTLQTLFSSEATYQSTTGNGNYGTLEELRKEGLVDPVLGEGHRFGYLFRVRREQRSTESPQGSLELVAVPRTYGRTGRRSFYTNESGVIHYADKHGAEANPRDDLMVIDP